MRPSPRGAHAMDQVGHSSGQRPKVCYLASQRAHSPGQFLSLDVSLTCDGKELQAEAHKASDPDRLQLVRVDG